MVPSPSLETPVSSLEIVARRIALARGEIPADLLLKNARLVNVLSGEVHDADIAVADGLVLGFGNYEARAVFDLNGRHVAPGLIDGHIHIESTMLCPREFAWAAARRGTAAVVCDPHEIANVLGAAGIEYMLETTRDSPLTFHFMMPSCVPATHLETAGAALGAGDVRDFLARHGDRVLGLAEMMNFPGVLFRDPEVLDKLLAAGDRPIDGHAPLLSGRDLAAYALAGPSSDHECTSAAEALEKLRRPALLIREGTSENNLDRPGAGAQRGQRGQRLPGHGTTSWPRTSASAGTWTSVRHAIRSGIPPVRACRWPPSTPRGIMGAGRGAGGPGLARRPAGPGHPGALRGQHGLSCRPRVRDLCFRARAGTVPANTMRPAGVGPGTFRIPAGRGRLRSSGSCPARS
jgi:adenine deaminase